jgi:hypothetical protein
MVCVPSPAASIDPGAPSDAGTLIGSAIDPLRIVCLPRPTAGSCAAAVIGLANARGGQVWLGARADTSGKAVRTFPGVDPLAADALLREIWQRIDPPLTDLISTRTLPLAGDMAVLVISVRQSTTPPHIDSVTGRIFLRRPDGTRHIASRAELHALYQKGAAADQRAERLIEAQIERLSLAQFGHYGLAVVASSTTPDSSMYTWSREHPEELTDPADPFMQMWGFSQQDVRVLPGVVELRSEREIAGIVRISRAGSVVAGEIQRRAPGDRLGPAGELSSRLEALVETVCRLLSHSDCRSIVAHLYGDGLKGARLLEDGDQGRDAAAFPRDVVQMPGPNGDPRDRDYRRRLHQGLVQTLLDALRHDVAAQRDG